jgi:formylmethanofuran dehydrogenase subunit E
VKRTARPRGSETDRTADPQPRRLQKQPNHRLHQPRPHFKPRPDDPAWLVEAVRLHGHLGPWLVVGLRIGQRMLADLGSEGFFNIQVQAIGPIAKPPERCLVDGLQFATGATMGKDNIKVRLADRFEFRASSTQTGRDVRYGLRETLLKVIGQTTVDSAEDVSRRIARQSFDRIARAM